jgi:hypothetical protein
MQDKRERTSSSKTNHWNPRPVSRSFHRQLLPSSEYSNGRRELTAHTSARLVRSNLRPICSHLPVQAAGQDGELNMGDSSIWWKESVAPTAQELSGASTVASGQSHRYRRSEAVQFVVRLPYLLQQPWHPNRHKHACLPSAAIRHSTASKVR